MLALDWYLIVFRILHIGAGVAWVGSVFLLVFFLQPTAAAIGPQAGPFMAELLGRRRLVIVILWLAATTIVAGGFLYWRYWDLMGLGEFVRTRFGLALTVGAVLAIAAFLVGLFGTRPKIDRVLALGRRAAEAEGPPPPELTAEIAALQGQLKILARTSFVLLVVSVLAMATARYL